MGEERSEPSEVWKDLERIWCEALIPEGPDVIQRVTTRVLELRVGRPQAAVREKCDYADKYKALQPPKCGCSTCEKKWLDQAKR